MKNYDLSHNCNIIFHSQNNTLSTREFTGIFLEKKFL